MKGWEQRDKESFCKRKYAEWAQQSDSNEAYHTVF
jgi:hypothetical protein